MADYVQDAAIWQRYERDRPLPGRDLSLWVSKLSEESGVPESAIRRVVARGAGALMNAISERVQTHAQKVAEMMGADLVAALEVARNCLTATKKKVLLDRSGRPKLLVEGPDGPGYVPDNMIYIEMPDYNVQLGAVRALFELHGARAPVQYEIDQKIVTLDLTPHAALAELERLSIALPRLRDAISDSQPGVKGSTRRRAAIESTASDS